MSASRRRFTAEFKDELCQEVISTSKPIKEVAAHLPMPRSNTGKWLARRADPMSGHGHRGIDLAAKKGDEGDSRDASVGPHPCARAGRYLEAFKLRTPLS